MTGQTRLNDIVTLDIEHKKVIKMNKKELTSGLANTRARKKNV